MDHDVVPHIQWRGPLRYVVCGPLGAAANLFAPLEGQSTEPGCTGRGQRELDGVVDKINDGLRQAYDTGQLAVAFGVPLLQRRLRAKIAASRGRPMPAVPDPASASSRDDAAEMFGNVEPRTAADASSAPRITVAPLPEAPLRFAPLVLVAELAIPGYDTLSASQVVERLSGLTEDDRARVRSYEIANRGRRTILGKLDQLNAVG